MKWERSSEVFEHNGSMGEDIESMALDEIAPKASNCMGSTMPHIALENICDLSEISHNLHECLHENLRQLVTQQNKLKKNLPSMEESQNDLHLEFVSSSKQIEFIKQGLSFVLLNKGLSCSAQSDLINEAQIASSSFQTFHVQYEEDTNEGMVCSHVRPFKRPLLLCPIGITSDGNNRSLVQTINLGIALYNVGLIHHIAKSFDNAYQFYESALKMAIDVLSQGGHQEQKLRQQTLVLLIATANNLANVSHLRGNVVHATQYLSQALNCGLNGMFHFETKEGVIDHKSAMLVEYFAVLLSNFGKVQYAYGNCEYAITCHNKALQFVQSQLGDDHHEFYMLHFELGQMYQSLSDYVSAMKHYNRIIFSIAAVKSEGFLVVSVLNEVEIIKLSHQCSEVSNKDFESKLHQLRQVRLLNYGSTNPTLPPLLNAIGRKLSADNRQEEAIIFHNEALRLLQFALRRRTDESVVLGFAITLLHIGKVNIRQGLYGKARISFLDALKISGRVTNTEFHPLTCVLVYNLAMVQYLAGSCENALELFDDTMKLLDFAIKSGKASNETGAILHNIGVTKLQAGRTEEAIAALMKALRVRKGLTDCDEMLVSKTLFQLGCACQAMDQHEEALKIFILSLKVEMSATHDGNYLDTAVVLQKIAGVYNELGFFEKALATYQEILTIFTAAHGIVHEANAETFLEIGNTFHQMGLATKAKNAFCEAAKIIVCSRTQNNTDVKQASVLVEFFIRNFPAAAAA